jgi:ubiquinone/menaquinone biosynthesis C-methylase UbiE
MSALQYDNEATQRLLAIYVTPDVVAQRNQFLQAFGPQPGERVLDVGSGPGFLAAAIAEAVGSAGYVCGVDISEPLLAVGRSHCARQAWVEFRHGDAGQLPFPDHAFDALVSTQVLEYVRDVDTALAEFHRVVRPGGRVGILDTDWDSLVWHSPSQELTKRVLAAWDQHATDPYLPRTLANRLRRAGFSVESQQVMALFNPAYDAETYSNRVIDLIVAFVVGRGTIPREEADRWAREVRQAGERGEYFFSLNRYSFQAKRV